MSVRLIVLLLLLPAIANPSNAQTPSGDCMTLFSTGSGSTCISGGTIALAEFTPSEDLTVSQVNIPGAQADITVSDTYQELARTIGNSSHGGLLGAPISLKAGETYYFAIRAAGCPKRGSSQETTTPAGTWKTDDALCQKPPCYLAAELYGPGCPVNASNAADGESTPQTTTPSTTESAYLLVLSATISLMLISYYAGKVRGKNDAIDLIVKFREIKVDEKNGKKINSKETIT